MTLGSGLISIGDKAFSGCNIAKVFWLGNTPPTNYKNVTALINYVANDQYSLSNQKKYQFLSSKFEVDGAIYVPVSPSERTCDVIDCEYSLQNGDIVIKDKVTNRGVELSVININDYAFYENQTISSLNVCNQGYIGQEAFYNSKGIKNIIISSKGNIRDRAFYGCNSIESASIDNVGSIGSAAFNECTSLNNIVLGDSITTIRSNAFYSCTSLPTITLPNNLTAIGEYTFYGCSKLETVNIGTGISGIPRYSFGNCSVLNNLIIPNNVKSIGDYAFYHCSALANLTFEDNEPEEEPEAAAPQTFDDWTSTNHSDNSTSYKEYAINVTAGDQLSFNYTVDSESGYDYLVVKINGVEVVKVSGSSTDSYVRKFTGAENVILYLSYTKDSSSSSGQDQASVYNIMLNGLDHEINSLQLGSNGSNPLFSDCPLNEVYIGRKLSYNTRSNYGYSPFYRNTSLRSVEITDAETEIYDNEFYGCTNLKTLKIGNGVKTIGKWAFSGCSSLDYFSAGYHVETIGEEAFSDCTGLTNYYSFSILPPVCGKQALDDINKWDCTLFVPAESSDEYMAADQWKDFFFVNENDAVLIESIRFNVESLDGKTGDTFRLTAEILPGNATRKRLEWSSSDPAVATVDAEGTVTFVKEGEATITARATDGSGVEASVNVVVTVKEPELGDSNANGVVNIADAVNTANYAIGNPVDHFNETAADVNRDGRITLADATATISLILEQPVQAASPAKFRAAADCETDRLVIGDYSVNVGESASVAVALDSSMDYVALQADVTVPEGMTLATVNIGHRAEANHCLTTKRINARKMRIALFDINNSAFEDNNGSILDLCVTIDNATSGKIEIGNILASDARGYEYALTSTGGSNTVVSGIDNPAISDLRIEATSEGINILNAEGREINIFTVDGTVLVHFIARAACESYKTVPGVYVVAAGDIVEKVVVK